MSACVWGVSTYYQISAVFWELLIKRKLHVKHIDWQDIKPQIGGASQHGDNDNPFGWIEAENET